MVGSSSLSCERLALPVLPQVGHRRFSYHWSRMAERLGGFRWFVGPVPDCPVLTSTDDIGGMMPHVRLGALKPDHPRHQCGAKCPSFTMICAYIRSTPAGQGSANDGSVS